MIISYNYSCECLEMIWFLDISLEVNSLISFSCRPIVTYSLYISNYLVINLVNYDELCDEICEVRSAMVDLQYGLIRKARSLS